MSKSTELKTTTDLVKELLAMFPDTRNNDNTLYYRVLAAIGKTNGIDIEKMSVPYFLLHLKEFGFPAFETVRRTRQKIQECNPNLAASADVEAGRKANESAFENYARKVIV